MLPSSRRKPFNQGTSIWQESFSFLLQLTPPQSRTWSCLKTFVAGRLGEMGVDLRRPLLAQISRFDPWKDPLGVIETYRIVKKARPEVQLAMLGAMAGDDPEAWGIFDQINAEAQMIRIFMCFTNLTGVGSMEVNAFLPTADVVLQKSLREDLDWSSRRRSSGSNRIRNSKRLMERGERGLTQL
jgi:hypothetical protein